jgi:hypothetical protein
MRHRPHPAQRADHEVQQRPDHDHGHPDRERVSQSRLHPKQQAAPEQHRRRHQPAPENARQIVQYRQGKPRPVQTTVVEQQDQDRRERELGGQVAVPGRQGDQASTEVTHHEQRPDAVGEQWLPGWRHPAQVGLNQPQARPSWRLRRRRRLGRACYWHG